MEVTSYKKTLNTNVRPMTFNETYVYCYVIVCCVILIVT